MMRQSAEMATETFEEETVDQQGLDLLDSCYEDIAFALYLVHKVVEWC